MLSGNKLIRAWWTISSNTLLQAREAILDSHQGKIPPLLGYYMGLSSPPLAKVVAQLGYDLVWIDWEHASTNVETMTQVSKSEHNRSNNSNPLSDGPRYPIHQRG
jgi:hypothetical protein